MEGVVLVIIVDCYEIPYITAMPMVIIAVLTCISTARDKNWENPRL